MMQGLHERGLFTQGTADKGIWEGGGDRNKWYTCGGVNFSRFSNLNDSCALLLLLVESSNATSKVHCQDELEGGIVTLEFQGEALSSLLNISLIEITPRCRRMPNSYREILKVRCVSSCSCVALSGFPLAIMCWSTEFPGGGVSSLTTFLLYSCPGWCNTFDRSECRATHSWNFGYIQSQSFSQLHQI